MILAKESSPRMAIKVTSEQLMGTSEQSSQRHGESDALIECSVGIMAYNEEANIERTIRAALEQRSPSLCIKEVIVVASGCTDRTVPLVAAIALEDSHVRLCVQAKREGKASAINLFLKQATSAIVILIGADIIPETGAFEKLCAPFHDPKIGMVGGRPVPVNDPSTFMGHTVHLLWRLHDRVARVAPKLGEVIAFRNVVSGIPANSSVDEISLQALISQLGYQLIYKPDSVVYNKGPVNLKDYLKQRRRIYAGHLKVLEQQHYEASTMKVSPILRQLLACREFTMSSPRQTLWTLGAVILEACARLLGYYDFWRKRDHYVWQRVDSTKNLEEGELKKRRICNAQTVLVFHFMLEGADGSDAFREREEREATEVAKKLLPTLRTFLRKEDTLSINGPGIMTAVIRAEQREADVVASRIKEAVAETPVRVGGRQREVRVAYSALTFTVQSAEGGVTVSGPLVESY